MKDNLSNMWIARFKNWHKDCIIRPRCVKYNVTDNVYLINSWTEKGHFYYTELHILQGREEDIKRFIKDFKKDKTILNAEVKGNNIITLNEKHESHNFYDPLFDHRLIYVKPVVQRLDGYEDWEIACWDKKPLMEIMNIPTFDMKLIWVKNVKFTDLFIPRIYPKLSAKQKQALELAVKEGYYEYPRKTELETLAKISKVKRQTYQEHLRRAEHKLVPFLTEGIE
ncbi:MAG: helix-turn-helix domain-containing protein [Candidatus Woesearchaeota archaeon]